MAQAAKRRSAKKKLRCVGVVVRPDAPAVERRAAEVAQWLRKRGIDLSGKRARQVTNLDVETADYVIAMDQSNLRNLRRYDSDNYLAGKAHLLLDFADGADIRDVPDPYYEGNFGRVYDLVEDGCRGLLDHIREEESL